MWAILNIYKIFDILSAILEFKVFLLANCYENYLIQHYISNDNGMYDRSNESASDLSEKECKMGMLAASWNLI